MNNKSTDWWSFKRQKSQQQHKCSAEKLLFEGEKVKEKKSYTREEILERVLCDWWCVDEAGKIMKKKKKKREQVRGAAIRQSKSLHKAW